MRKCEVKPVVMIDYFNKMYLLFLIPEVVVILFLLIHTVSFLRKIGSYNFGYEVGPNGQFHHETRGPDGVTYGCYGYIDLAGKLRATHYVADSQGYRVVEPHKAIEIFPENLISKTYDENENGSGKKHRPQGQTVDWVDLYFPKGCGMFEGGVRPDIPVKPLPGGGFVPVRYNER